MRSQLDVRLGVQEPQILHLPPDVHSLDVAQDLIDLANAYTICDGNPLSESQEFTLKAGCGERIDGTWAASTVADFKPRQGGGKSDTINAREFGGLILLGEDLIIHTAHEFKTANESFLRMVAIFENWDDLRRKVLRVRYANGEQGIDLKSGQRLKYAARTGSAGRGFTKAALVVYDEAQHVTQEHVASSGPARLANPNSQSWYAGSGGLSMSKQAWMLRRRALEGDAGRFAYVENTAELVEIRPDGRISSIRPDPTDRQVWYLAMPGLGRWVTEEAVETQFGELGPEKGARELLCVWDPEPQVEANDWEVLTEDAWSANLHPDAGPEWMTPHRWALDLSPDGRSAAIAASDGTGVEVVDYRQGSEWVLARLLDLRNRHTFGTDEADALVLDSTGPATALLQAFDDAGIVYQRVTFDEHAQACAQTLTAVDGGEFRHMGQEALDEAARVAKRRSVVDRWLWTRTKSDGDICPLVAVGLARWAAHQQVELEPPKNPAFTDLHDYLDDEE